jgi:predicted DNA-binding transcriptional regulator YafY
MRRDDRLFDVIQALRSATGPTTASALAERLEVTVRTIYRDIATLQARRVPIEGAAGVGYVLRRGFDLPPLMFTTEEIDAIAVGVRLLRRLRDPALQNAAESVLSKIAAVVPEPLKHDVMAPPIFVSDGDAATPTGIDLSAVRAALRDNRKIHLTYADLHGNRTERTIWPVALAYYVDVTILCGWCELRADFRHFRLERILASTVADAPIPIDSRVLMERWRESRNGRTADDWQPPIATPYRQN